MTLDDLICKQEIQDLLLMRTRFLDEGKLAEAQSLYSDDAIIVGPTGKEIRARDRDMAEMRQTTANLKPRLLTNIVVTPTGPDSAEAFAYITLPRPELPQGEWRYEFRRTSDGWRITRYQAIGIEPAKK